MQERPKQIAALVLAGLAALSCPLPAGAAQQPPAQVVVVAREVPQRQVIQLQPGYTTFLVFDAPVKFVALGDSSIVEVVVRAQEGMVGLRPVVPTGRTNMHILAGDRLTVWEVLIGSGPRTADVVRVVTQVPEVSSPAPQRVSQAGGPGAPSSAGPAAGQAPPGAPARTPPTPPQGEVRVTVTDRNPAPVLEEGTFRAVQASASGLVALFQAYRTKSGLQVYYQVQNRSGTDWVVIPQRIVVRADGRIVPVEIVRRPASTDPSVLPHGAVEAGVIVLARTASRLEVVFPFFSRVLDPKQLPVVFTASFKDLDGLPEVSFRSN